MLIKNIFNMAYSTSGTSNAAAFNQFYYDAYRTWSVYYAEAYRDVRAYAGDNWTNQEKQLLQHQRRQIIDLNYIRRVINLYSGFERENRKSIIVGPEEYQDEDAADILSQLMLYIYDKGNAHHFNSEAFEHALKSGLGIIGIYIDYSKDKINGDIKFYWKPFNAVMFDPYFTKRDLSDCDQASTRDLLSKDHVKRLLPFVSEREIDDIPTGIRDNKYQYLGVFRQYNSTYIAKHLVTYDQYWKTKQVPAKYLIDQETGEQTEFRGDDEDIDILHRFILPNNDRIKLINSRKKTVELSVIVGGTELYVGKDPTGLDDFPFRPVIPYFEPLIDTYELKIQGVVRSMRDSQRLYNRRVSQMTDIMESIINSGWIIRNGAVVDPDMLYQTGQGRNIVLADGYTLGDIQQIQPPQVPPSYFQYVDVMKNNMMEIPGGSEELMGISSTGDSQISGKLAQVRASNGLRANRSIFDNFEDTLKQVGKLVLQCAQLNYSKEKIQRIVGREVPDEILSSSFEKYDCTLKEAVLTQTQKEAYYYELLRLRELGIAIPDDEIIEAAPLQGKTKLKERIQKQNEQQQEMQKIEFEDKRRIDELQEAKIEEMLSLAQERRARVLSDIGLARERISEAKQNNSKAILDEIKAIKELEAMDRQTISDSLAMAGEIDRQAREQAETIIDTDMQRQKDMLVQQGGQDGLR